MNAVAISCVAALGLLLFGLGLTISILRFRSGSLGSTPSDPSNLLYKLVRAHGNTAEYAAFAAVLMLYVGARKPEPWVLAVSIAFTVCRYLVVAGIVLVPSMARPNPLRFIGALGTYLCGAALCVALISGA